ncbi:hypothetical protein MCC01995_06380 [Bifidobacteriaceae bacterium MCC01995]|nr:hypothetical protein MCC01995_06380 [Bifidobacteriaceae bacterium MCC01995]
MKNPHSLEKPAATLIAAATLLAGMGLPPAALAADGSAPGRPRRGWIRLRPILIRIRQRRG